MNEKDEHNKSNGFLKDEENEIGNNILYSNSLIQNENNIKENKININTTSKNLLIMRISIIALAFIYIPMEIILEKKLSKIEIEHFFPSITNKLFKNSLTSKISNFIEKTLIDRESIMIYTCIIYVLFHPIIGLKITIVMQIFYYFGILLKCLIQGKRPNWLLNEDIQICSTSYSNPSGSFFIFSFFYLYTLVSFKSAFHKEKNKNYYSTFSKIILFSIYFFIFLITSLIYLFYKLHFIFEIIYTFCLTLFSITIIIDFDNIIQRDLTKKLKNIFKARKYKIRIFLYVIGMEFLAVVSYFFITENNNLSDVEDKIANSNKCSQESKEELGLQKTFRNISYSLGIIGAFWGACFTVEYNISKWWNSNLFFCFIKIIITLIFSFIILYIFSQIEYVTYEFNFLVNCFKYFTFYFINFGIVPFIFQLLKLNENNFEYKNQKRKILLFKPSIYAMKKQTKDIYDNNQLKFD